MANFAVFASGRGSNFQAIFNYFSNSAHKLAVLVSDMPHCLAVEFAREKQLPVLILDYSSKNRELAESAYHHLHSQYSISHLVLAGFMRLLTPDFTNRYRQQILNIHPSLLPAYPGTNAIERAFRAGEQYLGITIHYVDEGVDTGPIIYQESIERSPQESLSEIEVRIHELEHQAYPEVLKVLLDAVDSQPVPSRSTT